MQPTTSIVRMDLGLTSAEFNLAADRQGFIGPKVLPVIVVAKQASKFPKRTLAQTLKSHETERAPRSGYASDQQEFSQDEYSTQDHGLETPLDDREVAIYADVIDAEMEAVDGVVDGVLRAYELDAVEAVYNTTTWTGATLTTAVTNEWDDITNATPIADVFAAREKIFALSGQEPNALVINRFQMRNLIRCPEILDKIKYVVGTLPKDITPAMLAAAFDLEEIIVAGAAKNTANEAAAAAIGRIWSNEYAMLAKVARSNSLREPCIGRTFVWNGNGGGGPGTPEELAYLVEERRNPNDTGTIYRCRNDRGIKIINANCGHLLSNITT